LVYHKSFSHADRRVGNRFEGPCVNGINNNNDNDNGQEDQNLALVLELIRAEARQDDISELTSSVGDLNAISVRDALRSVMGENVINNDTDQSAGENSSYTTQENPVFAMTNNQALNVLNSIRLNPTTPQQPIQQAQDVEGLNLPNTLEHDEMLHVPPEDLNEKQLDAYLRCNEYLQSQARQCQGRTVISDVFPPIILIHGAPGTGKSFIVEKVVRRADELGTWYWHCILCFYRLGCY
jgi:Cdc6-like AAA superfamily ATPase